MPRILIAGCGYVGQAAAALFHERGWSVEGWTASSQSARQLGNRPYSVRAVDIADSDAVSAVREEFDVVIQCASSGGGEAATYRRVYLEGARNLLNAFSSARLLMASSTSVYPQKGGNSVDETSPASPAHERGQILREAEEIVLSHNGIVARLGGIYGPGRSFFLRKLLAGDATADEGGDRFVNQAHRDDIVSALFLLAERRADCGRQIYNVVDDQPIRARDAYQWLSKRLQRPLLAGTGNVVAGRKRGDSNKRVCNQKLRALGWEPRYANFSVAMSESVLPSFGFGQ
jgi:nucleoside-diphosphate-sugar epimerase